jgi:hypothetical protein
MLYVAKIIKKYLSTELAVRNFELRGILRNLKGIKFFERVF